MQEMSTTAIYIKNFCFVLININLTPRTFVCIFNLSERMFCVNTTEQTFVFEDN